MSDALRGNRARRPARASAVGLRPARLRRRAGAALPVDLRHPGLHRPARHVAEPLGVRREDVPGARGRRLRVGRRPAGDRRLGRRVDEARRLTVPRLARDRALPHVPLRRARAVRRRAVPHDGRGAAPRDPGEVVRRLRRDGDADAPPRPVRRLRDACGRRALRGLLREGLPRDARGSSATSYDGDYEASGRTSSRGRS